MKKIIIAIFLAALMGSAGYFSEQFLFQPAEPPGTTGPGQAHAPNEVLFKMPLGKFTVYISRKKQVLHLLINIDVYLAGAAEFERMNGKMGRAKFRDATISAISGLAETSLQINFDAAQDIDRGMLAAQIVRKLYPDFPMVRSARINTFHTSLSVRE